MKSFRNKLVMGALVVGAFVGNAEAAQVVVFEAPIVNWNQEVSANFATNRELGRAWVDVQVESNNSIGDEGPDREVVSKAVEGLYYDSARKQVLYRTPTGTIVCAEDATFLWRTYLKSTGQCSLTAHTEQRKIDDGFNVHEETVAEVVLDAQTPSADQHASASEATIR
jgi:hypothetical protein